MKKILISLTIVGVLSTMVIGGTGAVFFDKEIARNNVFKSGYIDLRLQKEGNTTWTNEENKTWEIPGNNWVPGETVSRILHLQNNGNVDAARTTMLTNVTSVKTDTEAAGDSGVLDKIDMDTKIILYRATFNGTNLLAKAGNVFNNPSIEIMDTDDNQVITLAELNRKEIDFGDGIAANIDKPLFMEFKFCETAVAGGYQGDKVEVDFSFGIHQH